MIKLENVLSHDIITEHEKLGYERIICPICGNETFDMYFICPHCNWENDGIENIDLNIISSSNNSTISDYKDKFLSY